MPWDFGNNLNWDSVLRDTFHAQALPTDPTKFLPISSKIINVDASVLLIGGFNGEAKSTWFTAGWVSPRLDFSPSSTSALRAAVQAYPRVRFGLNKLTLLKFNDFDLGNYFLEVDIAPWHQRMLLEIWKYSGSMGDLESGLTRIETKIDAINP